jgi:muramoyltetrapeptide carboxypeptidase
MNDDRLARRQFLKLSTVISMSTLMTGCANTLLPTSTPSLACPRLRLMALGGPMIDPVRAQRGVDTLRTMGFALENLDCVTRRHSRFAGSVAERLADLNALAEPDASMPEMIMATRGGYGAVQLLDQIDYARLCPRLRQHGTILMGYSDNTAVQLALLARGNVTTFSGPMLYGDFATASLSAFTQTWLARVLSQPSFTLRVDVPQTTSLECGGRLWGGNLSVLSNLIGTPYLPQVPGGILFIEDVGEDVYRVERMLQQCRLAGVLGQQSAILLGHFSRQRVDGFDPGGYTLTQMTQQLSEQIKVPILHGLPVGHVADIVPLPIGAQAQLSADNSGFSLSVSGYPTLAHLPTAFLNPTDLDISPR